MIAKMTAMIEQMIVMKTCENARTEAAGLVSLAPKPGTLPNWDTLFGNHFGNHSGLLRRKPV